MRYFAIGAAAFALTYFLDPENGRWRRQALRAWLADGVRRFRERPVEVAEEPAAETIETVPPLEPSDAAVPMPAEAPATEAQTVWREPVPAGVAAEPEPDEAPQAVAVAERPVAEAVLPPPLPPEVLETPAREAPVEEPVGEEPRATAPKRRRWLVVGAAVLIAAGLAAAGLAAWSADVFDGGDEEPSASAQALSTLAERQARAISIMAQPGATRIPVAGAEERLLLIVGAEGDAVLLVSRLERAPEDKTYEIWVIEGQTPRPAGLFKGGGDAVVPLTRPVPKGAIVALTLEPVGGSPSPTSTPIYTVKRS